MIVPLRDQLRRLASSRRTIQWPPRRPRLVISGGLIVAALIAAAPLSLHQLSGPAVEWKISPLDNEPKPAATVLAVPREVIPSPEPPPAGLPTITYSGAPAGFPADPDPLSTVPRTEAAHPISTIAAYDAPGGRPLAFLAPTINGVPLTMPIVDRRADWVAVVLPSVNRTIAWLAPRGWSLVALRDQIVVRRSSYELTWYRDGAPQQTWVVTLGLTKTPTPLGRTFVLGRSTLPGSVYGGLDVLALGAVPDNVDALPAGLRGAHIGIHSWYNDATLGKKASDGCIRLTKSGHRALLSGIAAGTPVVVVD